QHLRLNNISVGDFAGFELLTQIRFGADDAAQAFFDEQVDGADVVGLQSGALFELLLQSWVIHDRSSHGASARQNEGQGQEGFDGDGGGGVANDLFLAYAYHALFEQGGGFDTRVLSGVVGQG